MPDRPELELRSVSKTFSRRRRRFGGRAAEAGHEAVSDVSFSLSGRGSLGIVGESGSGKTTLARMIVGLEVPTSGEILLRGQPLSPHPTVAERRARAREIQIVFQDPYTSLDPRQRVGAALDEVQRQHFDRSADDRRRRTRELLDEVGLGEELTSAYPRQLSGGQRQRVAIARALAAEPAIVLLDEAVSALDVSIQAQILNMLARLRRERALAFVLISHDLAVVRQLSDEVLVIYRGRAVERGPVERILSTPSQVYTKRLLASVPRPGDWLRSAVPAREGVAG
jgi:peptide/nickel transport system ATP-binding protein